MTEIRTGAMALGVRKRGMSRSNAWRVDMPKKQLT